MIEHYIPHRYKLMEKLGEGVHGVVVKAHDTHLNRIVAIKKVALRTKLGGISPNTVREIKVLQNCDCENILSLISIYPDVVGLSLVMDFVPHTLYSKLRDDENPILRSDVQNYTKMLFNGLGYLHNLNIMHRDIKPANLLITESGILKIADFGLSRLFNKEDRDKSYSPQVASRWYRPPELLWGDQKYTEKIDIWAAGCVFAEMLRGIALFNGSTDIEQLALVVRTLGTPNSKDWPDLKQLPDYNKIRFPPSRGEKWENIFPSFTTKEEIGLVNDLVKYNPKKRLSACEVSTNMRPRPTPVIPVPASG